MESKNINRNPYGSCFTITTGIVAGWEGQTYINRGMRKIFDAYSKRQMKELQGGGYKSSFHTALEQYKLENKLKIADLSEKHLPEAEKLLGFKIQDAIYKKEKTNFKTSLTQLKNHIMRTPENTNIKYKKLLNGEIAVFSPKRNMIICNFDKYGSSCFHEIAHKLNSDSSNPAIKLLSKTRGHLAIYGPLGISVCAMLTNKKENKTQEKIHDKIKNNCGILTFFAMTPMALEETIANCKGYKIAQKAGVTGQKLAKVQKGSKFSNICYWTTAIIAGISAWTGNKIRDFVIK